MSHLSILLLSLAEGQLPSEFVFLHIYIYIVSVINPSCPTFVFIKIVVMAVYCRSEEKSLDPS